jgi:hypothetical protein
MKRELHRCSARRRAILCPGGLQPIPMHIWHLDNGRLAVVTQQMLFRETSALDHRPIEVND